MVCTAKKIDNEYTIGGSEYSPEVTTALILFTPVRNDPVDFARWISPGGFYQVNFTRWFSRGGSYPDVVVTPTRCVSTGHIWTIHVSHAIDI